MTRHVVLDEWCSVGGSAYGTDRSARPGRWRGSEFSEQVADACVDVVADGPDLVEGLTGGVGELPLEVALAGEDRAGVSSAHGDHDVSGRDGDGGQAFGELAGQVDPDLVHDLTYCGVDLVGGFGPGGGDAHGTVGVVVQ